MSLILNVDTSVETAVVNIADNGTVVFEQINPQQKDHAAFLETAIRQILQKTRIQFSDLAAFAVVAGPGSYTGLRIGMASVKSLCYALKKPLILLNKLEVLTLAAIKQNGPMEFSPLYCAMIDARRMEVFSAIYNHELKEILKPQAMILDDNSFKEILEKNNIFFVGNGSEKWAGVCKHKNARFIGAVKEGNAMAELSLKSFNNQRFDDIVFSTPLYIKEVFDQV